jgi:putative DNA primase/helicase
LKDLTHGSFRRLNVLPFCRQFSETESDVNRVDRILATEMPGLINRALAGLWRLRQRERFDAPAECRSAVRQWQQKASAFIDYMERNTQRSAGHRTAARDLYAAYKVWCDIEIRERPLAMRDFMSDLEYRGYKVIGDYVQNLKMRAE